MQVAKIERWDCDGEKQTSFYICYDQPEILECQVEILRGRFPEHTIEGHVVYGIGEGQTPPCSYLGMELVGLAEMDMYLDDKDLSSGPYNKVEGIRAVLSNYIKEAYGIEV